MRPAERLAKYRRKTIKKANRTILHALGRVIAQQSLIGDQPVFDKSVFPWTQRLEANWKSIRTELDEVLQSYDYLPSFHELSPDQKRISRGDNWKTFVFCIFGDRYDPNCKRCPETARLLDQIPCLQNAWFSILSPHYHIPPHQGPTKGLIRVHLGLKIPQQHEKCRIRVHDQYLNWQEGQCIVFDDFYQHEVWNDSNGYRIVLFLDVERPMRPLGRLLNTLTINTMKHSAYVQDALKNIDAWERRYKKVAKPKRAA